MKIAIVIKDKEVIEPRFEVSLKQFDGFVGVIINGITVIEFAQYRGNQEKPSLYIAHDAGDTIADIRNYSKATIKIGNAEQSFV